VAIFLLIAIVVAGSLRAQTALPPNMTQEQYDALVNAITKSVIEKLKTEGVPPAAASPTKHSPFDVTTQQAPDEIDIFLQRATKVIQSVPALGESFARVFETLDRGAESGHTRGTLLILLVIAAGGALAAETILRRLLHPLSSRLAAGAVPEKGLRSLYFVGLLALLDGLGVFALWFVTRAAAAFWFSAPTTQDWFALAILSGLLYWRLYALAFRIILRPGLGLARLCDMTDDNARRVYRLISAFVLLAIAIRTVFRALLEVQAPVDAIAAGRMLAAPLLFAALLWFVVRSRQGMHEWLGGLGRTAAVVRFIGDNWVGLMTSLFVALVITQVYGAVSGRTEVPTALLLTINLLIGLLIFETVLQAVVRRLDSQLPGLTPAGNAQKLPDVIARCLRVAALIGIVAAISESWVVNVLGLVDASAWNKLARASSTAGITLFAAFVLWELFKYATEAYVARLGRQSAGAGDGGNAGAATSRLDTLMPLLRVTIAIILGIIAALIALEDLGVNITPLLAGASVLGLALSFGSQTLVKDVVSGIFYLADDAFRVGEYVDCGSAKGIVEGFTVRSIRLRSPDGQIITIPFGDLGRIANFSRDWASVKFSLRFARDTDLDKLREATAKIGAQMMEAPELKAEIIEPLKMQGVDEVADNALVIRFKYKARPGNPGAIQNAAVTRMLRTLPTLGIEFAK
jgi:small-conductance mechanosensitive channel